MSKRRKILLNDMEVTITNTDDPEILEYIDTDNNMYIQEESSEMENSTQQFLIDEEGNTVQYITAEELQEEEPDEADELDDIEEVDIANATGPKTPYQLIKNGYDNTLLLYCDKQLYMQRKTFYRCRLFPECLGAGIIVDGLFQEVLPHESHPDQEDRKNSLVLYNKFQCEEELERLTEDCGDEDMKDNVEQIILTQSSDVLTYFKKLLGRGRMPLLEDPRPFNNFEKGTVEVLEELNFNMHIIFSSGHIYMQSENLQKYRCFRYPKCLASGCIIKVDDATYFQLLDSHSSHGFQDDGQTFVKILTELKKSSPNLENLEELYHEEIQKPCYDYQFRSKFRLDKVSWFLYIWKKFQKSEHNNDKEETPDSDTNSAYPYTVIDGGAGNQVIFCNDQLYIRSQIKNHFKCRLYHLGCPATGVRITDYFLLTSKHVGHGSQLMEKLRLEFLGILKQEAATNSTTPLQTIYQETMKSHPQFSKIANVVPYHSVYKIMKRAKKLGVNGRKILSPLKSSEIKNKKIINLNSSEEPETQPSKNRTFSIKNSHLPVTDYILMEGERLGSCILYSNEQLYTLNRNNYYRCRMYPHGCQATGMREGNVFRLCRGHSAHGSQEPERRRIMLINAIKKRTMTNPDPDHFESIFNEECEKPEYSDIVERVSFTVVLNNMRKIWKRFQQQDPTLKRNIMRTDMEEEDLYQKMEERELKDAKEKEAELIENEESAKMAVEVGEFIECDDALVPSPFTMMEGERLGSCLLYSNQQLYTYNQRNYYRCRMYGIGCRATGIKKDNLFYLLKRHNGHGSQEREVRRLILVTKIKRRAQIDPSRLEDIFKEESSKPEFADVADMVYFKKIHGTLDRCRRKAASDVLEVVEPTIPPGMGDGNKEAADWQKEFITNSESTSQDTPHYFVEIDTRDLVENVSEEVPKPSLNTKQDDESLYKAELQQELTHLDSQNDDPELGENEEALSNSAANYEMIGGDRFGSKLLYYEGNLYTSNRDDYFRCRLYPNCIATGRVRGNRFRLTRGHSEHLPQEDEKKRLIFLNRIKARVQEEINTPIKTIFDDECSKPENLIVGSSLDFKSLLSTLVKCRTRSQQKTKDCPESESALIEEFVEDEEAEVDCKDSSTELVPNWDIEQCSESESEETSTIPKPDINAPTKYIMMQGDRQGSLLLYTNGHLYTKNRGTYYRCRKHPFCCGAGNRRGHLFYITRQHSNHPLQLDEKCRLSLMNAIKARVLTETTPLKTIYDQEIIKPEFASISDFVSFRMIQSTMIKIRERLKAAQAVGSVVHPNDNTHPGSHETNHTVDSENDQLLENGTENEDEQFVYYYIMEYEDTVIDDTDFTLNKYVQREHFNTPSSETENPSINPITVYTLNVDEMEVFASTINRKVHLPDDTLQPTTVKSGNESLNSHTPCRYSVVEDCMNDKLLIYANKQLYVQKQNFFQCRIKSCNAFGKTEDGFFYLLCDHNNHVAQNKVKLQLQLIARIKTRCMTRKTARVSKIFREECLKPEFRSVANTITLDGISEMIKKYRNKMFPKSTLQTDSIDNTAVLTDLPPPATFLVVNGTSPEVKLIYSEQSLFYHAGKGVYHCQETFCPAFGRRDRTFFQLLHAHSEHEAIEIEDKERLIELINKLEEMLKDKVVNVSKDKSFDDSDNPSNPFSGEVASSSSKNLNTLSSSSQSTKSILQQAWEELQVHI